VPPYSLVLRFLCNKYADYVVECKKDLSASRVLLVLEHNVSTRFIRVAGPVQIDSVASVQAGRGSGLGART